MSAAGALLLINQTIGPLFADVVTAAGRRHSVRVFQGMAYRRTPATARLLTWLGFSLQLGWHLLVQGRRYQRLLVVSNPPFAPLLAPLARRPYALLLYDLYPQVLGQLQPRRWLLREALHRITDLWQWSNRRVFRGAERVFTLSEAMAEELRPAFRSEELWRQRVMVVPPWADTNRLHPDADAGRAFRRGQAIDPQRLLITYAGNLGLTHPLEPLLLAAARWRDQGAAPGLAAPPLLLLIGQGPGRTALERRAAELALAPAQLRFLDPLPLSGLAGCLAAADLAVVALSGAAATASLPSKTFSALACGTPLLALAPPRSSLAQLVRQHRCGLVIEPGPAAAAQLVGAVDALARDRARLDALAIHALAASRHYTAANAERLLDAWLGCVRPC